MLNHTQIFKKIKKFLAYGSQKSLQESLIVFYDWFSIIVHTLLANLIVYEQHFLEFYKKASQNIHVPRFILLLSHLHADTMACYICLIINILQFTIQNGLWVMVLKC